jgi:hypothetical protein
LRLDVGPADWAEVGSFVVESYRMTAPKRLAERVAGPEVGLEEDGELKK